MDKKTSNKFQPAPSELSAALVKEKLFLCVPVCMCTFQENVTCVYAKAFPHNFFKQRNEVSYLYIFPSAFGKIRLYKFLGVFSCDVNQ